MHSTTPARPSVIASTVDGSLVSGRDYVSFTKEIVFERDRDVMLVVPITSTLAGTVSVMLSEVRDGTVERGVATALVPSRRRVVRQ